MAIVCFALMDFNSISATTADSVIIYKNASGTNLGLFILKAKTGTAPHPALLYFHGGGWNNGSAEKSLWFIKHFSEAGFVCASVEYRCRDINGGTTPMDATRDALSAVRAFAAHADELGIDLNKLVVAGGSAGGHLACMTAMGNGLGETAEDKTPLPKVAALLLWNPVVDTTDKGYGGKKRFGDLCERYSPVHLLNSNSPPVLVQHGDADQTVPYENVQRFIAKSKELGIKSKLVTYPGAKHSFTSGPENLEKLEKSYQEAQAFLTELKLWPTLEKH